MSTEVLEELEPLLLQLGARQDRIATASGETLVAHLFGDENKIPELIEEIEKRRGRCLSPEELKQVGLNLDIETLSRVSKRKAALT